MKLGVDPGAVRSQRVACGAVPPPSTVPASQVRDQAVALVVGPHPTRPFLYEGFRDRDPLAAHECLLVGFHSLPL
jgi:hypothetical protein